MNSMSRTAGNPDFIDFQMPKKKAKTTCECGALFKHPSEHLPLHKMSG